MCCEETKYESIFKKKLGLNFVKSTVYGWDSIRIIDVYENRNPYFISVRIIYLKKKNIYFFN